MSSQLLDWPTVEAILKGSRLTLLYGPPGTGKTTAAVNAARASGSTLYNVTLTDETPAAELRGHFIPQGDRFVWMDGPALTPFRAGGTLVLNELDQASGDCLDFCHALLDDPSVASMTLPSGETVFAHEDFKVVATMNGDPRDLREALRDRLAAAIHIGTAHPDAIASLPEDLQAPARNAAGNDVDEDRPATLRRFKVFAQLRDVVGADAAGAAVFAHRWTEVSAALKLGESR